MEKAYLVLLLLLLFHKNVDKVLFKYQGIVLSTAQLHPIQVCTDIFKKTSTTRHVTFMSLEESFSFILTSFPFSTCTFDRN